jgi:hypothetical protein
MSQVQETRSKTISDLKRLHPEGIPASLTTEHLAKLLGVRPQTVRRSYCLSGHYCGLVPVKLENRRLIWPLSE